jgi:uncharacterized protein CbrC (UPF0167 family)
MADLDVSSPRALPVFPYHRDPVSSGSVEASNALCACCGKANGIRYTGNVYSRQEVEEVCPWCIADGSAAERFDAIFIDGHFCDDQFNYIELSPELDTAVFARTIGFATFNPVAWWVHCGQPAEYVTRNEPYDLVFQCRVCGREHIVPDYD